MGGPDMFYGHMAESSNSAMGRELSELRQKNEKLEKTVARLQRALKTLQGEQQ